MKLPYIHFFLLKLLVLFGSLNQSSAQHLKFKPAVISTYTWTKPEFDWIFTKDTYHKYDLNGYEIFQAERISGQDTGRKSELIFDSQGNRLSYLISNKQGSVWVLEYGDRVRNISYDTIDGYVHESRELETYSLRGWNPLVRYNKKYHPNGKIAFYFTERYSNGTWNYNYKIDYIYDTISWKLTEVTLKIYDVVANNNTWNNFNRYTNISGPFYENPPELESYEMETFKNGIWKKLQKRTRTYTDTLGSYVVHTSSWNGTDWGAGERDVFKYNADHLLVHEYRESADSTKKLLIDVIHEYIMVDGKIKEELLIRKNLPYSLVYEPSVKYVYGKSPLVNIEEKDPNRLNIEMYPNPATRFVSFNQPINKLVLYNSEGQVMMEKSDKQGFSSVNLGIFPAGLYIVSITDFNQNLSLKKIQIQPSE